MLITGTVVSVTPTVHVKVWDSVKQGQPLFTLDERDLKAQLAVNEANASVADAELWRLVDQLKRLQSVKDPRAVSQDEVRTKDHDVQVAVAQLQAARALVTQNKVQLERLTVRAPRDGLPQRLRRPCADDRPCGARDRPRLGRLSAPARSRAHVQRGR